VSSRKIAAGKGAASRHDMIQALQAFLRSLTPIQAHAVVIVDEAQHLKPDVLEQIRLLANVDVSEAPSCKSFSSGKRIWTRCSRSRGCASSSSGYRDGCA